MENKPAPNNPATEPMPQPTVQANPSDTPQQPQESSSGSQTDSGQRQPGVVKRSSKKPLLIGILIILFLAGGGSMAMKLMNKNTPTPHSTSPSQAASNSIQWVKYEDPTLGFTFSYPKGWHISDSKTAKEPSGRTIYIGPRAINTDPNSLQLQYLDDPQLGFYIYNTNPISGHDNQPIEAPDKKVGTITFANGKSSALIEDKFTSYDDTITLSACPNAFCIFKIGSRFMSPSIKTLGSNARIDGHNINQSGSYYKTELQVLQSINY